MMMSFIFKTFLSCFAVSVKNKTVVQYITAPKIIVGKIIMVIRCKLMFCVL